jgi:MFS family permease
MANVIGRRILMIVSVLLFMLGSGVSGGASSTAMLIGGRTVQGLGSGAIQMMIDLIVADLVPMRERGNYMAIIQGVFAIGTVIGPLLGGAIVQHSSWRVRIVRSAREMLFRLVVFWKEGDLLTMPFGFI